MRMREKERMRMREREREWELASAFPVCSFLYSSSLPATHSSSLQGVFRIFHNIYYISRLTRPLAHSLYPLTALGGCCCCSAGSLKLITKLVWCRCVGVCESVMSAVHCACFTNTCEMLVVGWGGVGWGGVGWSGVGCDRKTVCLSLNLHHWSGLTWSGLVQVVLLIPYAF